MGVFDSIYREARKKEKYEKAKIIISRSLISRPFGIDTNILVVLAEHADVNLLGELIKSEKYIFNEVNRDELRGLAEHGHKLGFSHRTIHIMKQFLDLAKKHKQVRKMHTIEVERRLIPLIPLLPRRLVHDILILNKDSLFNNLLNNIEKIGHWDEERVRHEYDKEVAGLKQRFEDRYLHLCDSLGVDDFELNEKAYFWDVKYFKNEALEKIGYFWKKYGLGSRNFNMHVKIIADKTYKRDVKYVAEILLRKIEGHSLDSDVIWLFRLDAARKI